MSEAKHTPGPWTLELDSCLSCREKGESEFIIHGPPGAYHGQFSHEPDARLIAAAPDLLAACNAVIKALNREHCIAPDKDDDWIYDQLGSAQSTAYFTARAAIAKATGAP